VVGRVCWLVQPVAIVVELVTAWFVVAPYSFWHQTISDLGAVGCTTVAACVLWVVSGLSSVATGLVPIDVDTTLHALVSTPVIALQPVALLLHAVVLARHGSSRWWVLVGVAAVVLGVAVFFLVRLDVRWGGLLERAAIWPVLLAAPLLALAPAVGRWTYGAYPAGGPT
jgi:hypothetical protein